MIRIRTARTLRPGVRGWLERHVAAPFMNWMGAHVAMPRSIRATVDLLRRCAAQDTPVWDQNGCHVAAPALRRDGWVTVAVRCSTLRCRDVCALYRRLTPTQV